MAEEKAPKETGKAREVKLGRDQELRFDLEREEKVTIEVCINSI